MTIDFIIKSMWELNQAQNLLIQALSAPPNEPAQSVYLEMAAEALHKAVFCAESARMQIHKQRGIKWSE